MTSAAIAVICTATILMGVFGLSLTRSTGDFYVASRRISPLTNASAIAGEYLSAASFLGVVGLIYLWGPQGLWLPIGYTAGFLVLLLFVAAPLRRSGAYTLPDFMILRFRSAVVRRMTTVVVVLTGWLYVVPQLRGAVIVTEFSTGLPGWVGAGLVVVVVLAVVLSGGMRTVTVAQAVQYWVKLAALLIPAVFIVLRAGGEDAGQALSEPLWRVTVQGDPLIAASLVLALSVGAVGLPHVLVRFYTNPDGHAARRTAAALVGLVGIFYVIAVLLGLTAVGALGPSNTEADTALIQLPAAVLSDATGDVLVAVLVGGAFAAFLSTTSGLVVSVSGVISQELFGGSVRGFRIGALAAVGVPAGLTAAATDVSLAGAVVLVFTFAASTVAPVMLLGIWWSRITAAGAVSGMLTGAASTGLAVVVSAVSVQAPVLLTYPGLWSIPLSFAVIIAVSLTTEPPASTSAVLTKLHLPEEHRGQSRP
ncbi:cation acetate symporter [Nesterenkonia muleiensis]|uniref:sodium/solute symporter n=1 Tax=Nesterenkonia muleiensis TaxID=2282648 RepID=UPI001EE4CE65|nr:cation acetate symporter [Nesterenkonia muleiensis]